MTAQSDLRNGVNFTSNVLSARIYAFNQLRNRWQSIIEYIPDTTIAQTYAPMTYSTLPDPPIEGLTNPFTFTEGSKYVFVITIPMIENANNSYLQVIFDAQAMIQIVQQVSNAAEASTENLLVTLNSTTNQFQILLPTLFHTNQSQQYYSIASDKAATAAAEIPAPYPLSKSNSSSIRLYQSGIIFDYINFDGEPSTAGYARLYYGYKQSWALIVKAPQQQVVAPLNKLRNILLISDFATLIIMLFILMPIVWFFSKPLRTLRSVTQAAHEAPINIEGLSVPDKKSKVFGCIPRETVHDEITDLKESFILLAQSLNEQYYSMEAKVVSRTQEAVDANQMKSSFLATMSHEIRSPLQGIIALADVNMLENQDVSDEIKQTLSTIKESGAHLLYLISDILDFSKIEAGHLELEERVFALGTGLINQLRISAKSKAAIAGLQFSIITDPPHLYDLNLRGDKHRLYQILLNLLSNALKFTIAGSVTFKITNPYSNVFQFNIEDTGCGIPPRVLDTLFQPFTQADQSYSRKFGGTGLGLAVSKQLAELMQGEITVESEENKGSIFTLTVPLTIVRNTLNHDSENAKDSPLSQLSQQSRFSFAHSVRNVMIADDNLVNRQVISKMLKRCGVTQVTLAENGVEALELGRKRNFDLILMDISMPIITGLDATRMLREGGYEGMIVALTAHVGKEEHAKAIECGCDAVKTKPIVLDELRAFLQSLGR